MDRVTALYRAHIKFVYGVLWRTRMPVADVNDLAHDAFLVVLRKVRAQDHPPLASEDEERSWLYRITHFELQNYRRRARFRRPDPMNDHTHDLPDPRNDHARLEDRETMLLLLDSIQVSGGREVFELVELEGFTVAQAAATLDISEPNAHRRLRLARRDVEAMAAKLQSEAVAGKRKKSVLVMAFGVVPWLQLRGSQDPPAGTVEEIWERIQA
ncbi:MAG: sigma-70 family RNA polymerase sigma factor, partial [Byssovorax sp.]